MSYPCRSCGKYSFAQPTTCFWCADSRSDSEIGESVQAGIDRMLNSQGSRPPPTSALEEARLKLHKYRRHEKRRSQ